MNRLINKLIHSYHELNFFSESIPSFYYWSHLNNKRFIYNFGDQISPIIVEKILGKKLISSISFNFKTFQTRVFQKTLSNYNRKYTFNHKNRLFAIGSIMHHVNAGDHVWGTGILPNRIKTEKSFKNINIYAVRGPLTRNFLIANGNINCPKIYGDPAILYADLFPFNKRSIKREFGVIPQLHDIENKIFDNYEVALPTQNYKDVIKYILESEFVISSSLHAIIIAESYGIPARWLRSTLLNSYSTETTFKYNDYFLGTGRLKMDDFAETISEAKKMGSHGLIDQKIKDSLIKSFPFKIFK